MKTLRGAADMSSSVSVLKEEQTVMSVVKSVVTDIRGEDAFFIADLSDVVRKHKLWHALLPRVTPHYAVKCNEDPTLLKVIAGLGNGFDCASKSEIKKILDMGVAPDRIVYANPCKQSSHVKYAAKNGVAMMTFDNEAELYKIKAIYPAAKLILRILPPDDTKSQCQLGMKFGCHPNNTRQLLEIAKELRLNVIGVSFHVGSGCYDPTAFSLAVVMAHAVFVQGEELGFKFDILDIGGGFPGQPTAKITFKEICDELTPALDKYFPASGGVRIIAEPGRFFAASAFTLTVNIIAKRAVARDIQPNHTGAENGVSPTASEEPAYMYYVNDGVYGSFNCLMFDHAEVFPKLIQAEDDAPLFTSSIWGPTCDGLDCIQQNCLLPELGVGQWIVFEDMGAYTMCAASSFNGMPRPNCYHVVSESSQIYISGGSKVSINPPKKVPVLKSGHGINEENHDTGFRINDLTAVPDC